jgi:hypothetical protein
MIGEVDNKEHIHLAKSKSIAKMVTFDKIWPIIKALFLDKILHCGNKKFPM